MQDRRALVALGAVALFAAGFGLGWMVRGEHTSPAIGSGDAGATAANGATDDAVGDGGSADAIGSGEAAEASADEAGERDEDGDDSARGSGDVAVVGADESTRAASGEPEDEAGDDSETAAASPDGGVRGVLNASAIQDVVREHRDELGFCFAWQLHSNPDLEGRITMEFEIGADGQVTEARVADDALGDETVLRCFVNVTRRMEFPAPEGGGTVTVRYPFQLSPGGDPGDEP